MRKVRFFLFFLFFGKCLDLIAQCPTLGQTPATAFPVCGSSTFKQTSVPNCTNGSIVVPGCTGNSGNLSYSDVGPFWYKFTCYQAGTLGLTIDPVSSSDDYDWQIFDITNGTPNDVYANSPVVVSANWSGLKGQTGTTTSASNIIECGSTGTYNPPKYSKMPTLAVGHTYLLLISNFSQSQQGYNLSFGGGTAIITDPAAPKMATALPDCAGKKVTIKLAKKMRCNSLTSSGSEFTLSPAVATVTGASTTVCSSSFDFDELTLTLSSTIPTGTYKIFISKGTDNNSLIDFCDRPITDGDSLTFSYTNPIPTPFDSIGKVGCAPKVLYLYHSKKLDCKSIASNGTDFSITGPQPVSIASAAGVNCVNGESQVVAITLSSPIVQSGMYSISIKPGSDATTIIDACGLEVPLQTFSFNCVDTVSADFTFTNNMGCRFDTLLFQHNGAHNVTSWLWNFNGIKSSTTRNPLITFPASGVNDINLVVSNGVCTDTVMKQVVLNNLVVADFAMPQQLCPEDFFLPVDSSNGLIDSWQWQYGTVFTANSQVPQSFHFPAQSTDVYYNIQLTVTNSLLGCTDTRTQRLKVFNSCYIDVPTAFTPNGDGLNDYLAPTNAVKAQNLVFKVYNRWGNLIFSSKNWSDKWNGTINGIPQATGVYVWILTYNEIGTGLPVKRQGTTTLIR